MKIKAGTSGAWAAAIFIVTVLWNVAVLGTTAYAVFWLGHSGWWFALAIALLLSVE